MTSTDFHGPFNFPDHSTVTGLLDPQPDYLNVHEDPVWVVLGDVHVGFTYTSNYTLKVQTVGVPSFLSPAEAEELSAALAAAVAYLADLHQQKVRAQARRGAIESGADVPERFSADDTGLFQSMPSTWATLAN